MTIAILAVDTLGNTSSCEISVTVANGACVEIHPETLNLKSKGKDRSITVRVCGSGLEALLPTEAANLRLCVPGGSPVASKADFAGDDDLQDVQSAGFVELLLKFDRQQLIASIRAGRLSEAITGNRVVLALKAGDEVQGSDDMKLIGN